MASTCFEELLQPCSDVRQLIGLPTLKPILDLSLLIGSVLAGGFSNFISATHRLMSDSPVGISVTALGQIQYFEISLNTS